MTQSPVDLLHALASKYVWWKTADEALAMPQRVIAQVMNIGDFEDVLALESALGDTPLRDAITQAQAGQFNARSWHFWHYRLGLADVAAEIPPLPVRTFA